MKMKILIRCMLLLVTVWTRLHLLVADPHMANHVWDFCGNTKYISGSDFQRNLNQLLESLVVNVSTSGFNTSVAGQTSNSTVYGFVQCRGDLNSSHCKRRASTAKKRLLKKCHSTSGFTHVYGCFLRYDDHNFFDDYNENGEFVKICNPVISDQPEQFRNTTEELLSKVNKKAVNSPKFFATDKFQTVYPKSPEIYGLAQCWGDISQRNCRSCLAAGLSNISGPGRFGKSTAGCPTGAIGARYLSSNCILRFETRDFFHTSIIPPLPAPALSPRSQLPGHESCKVVEISLGVLAATLGSIAGISLWKWISLSRRKCWEHTSRARGAGGEINLSPTITNPELVFKYNILREAASNFREENKLGEGGFGTVFKGVLPDAREVAIKRLNIDSRQGDAEFLNEANLFSRVQHRNLVKLLGCCVESSERLLVYEYHQNSSLDKIIFDTTKRHLLHWRDRFEIIIGTARGLAYLHEESDIRIIHRDIKASNILLDNKHKPKIADFGLAKLFGEDQSHVSTRVAGTLGYMAPEYALRGQLTEKADVFSFGVLLLEIISGRKNQNLSQRMEFLHEATWRLYKEERALEIMDPTLEGSYSSEEANRVIKIGLLCTQATAALRPSMSRVVSMLTSEREHLSSPTRPAFIDLDIVAAPHQIQHPRVIGAHKTSSIAAAFTMASDIHSGGVDPSSGALEPR